MDIKTLRNYAISTEKFLKNYCYLMADSELSFYGNNIDSLLDMYQIIDKRLFDYISNLSIKNMRKELKKMGVETKGASFKDIDDADILIGDKVIVEDKFGSIFAFDIAFEFEYPMVKKLRRKNYDKY